MREALPAFQTEVGSLPHVGSLVDMEIVEPTEALLTLRTEKGPLSCIHFLVSSQVRELTNFFHTQDSGKVLR